MDSTQKVVIITGASQGIGAALVPAYRKLGYAVVANSRSIAPSQDPDVLTVAGDVAVPGVGARIAAEALDRFGRIDSLVNNAGVFVAKSLAIEYAGRGIRANTVALGIIRTPMHPADTHDFLAALHPLGRMGEISDVVEAVLYLETARFVTGETLHVDGGQSAGH